MAAKYKVGDRVRQILPAPLTGVVEKFEFDASKGDIRVIIKVDQAEDAEHERLHGFTEEEVELIKEAVLRQSPSQQPK